MNILLNEKYFKIKIEVSYYNNGLINDVRDLEYKVEGFNILVVSVFK